MNVFQARNSAPTVSVVLPTFNEAGNVPLLLSGIAETLTASGLSYECIFVDDSTDATAGVIRQEALKYPNQVTLIKRTGSEATSGLTKAFQTGFAHARGEIIVCMDTDLQHPPAKITHLVGVLQASSAQVAVCSRYVRGGSAVGLNGWFRHFVSQASSYLVWILLPSTRRTSDPMTGFFAFRRDLLPRLTFSSSGFKILVELLVALPEVKVVDIPFTFQKRVVEESKANVSQGIRFFKDLVKLFTYSDAGSMSARFVSVVAPISLVTVLVSFLYSRLFSATIVEIGAATSLTIVIFCVVIATVLIFYWSLRSYGYQQLSSEHIVPIVSFSSITIISYLFFEAPVTGLYSIGYNFVILSLSFVLTYQIFKPFWVRQSNAVGVIERMFISSLVVFLFFIFTYFLDFSNLYIDTLFVLYLVMIGQGIFALYLTIYIWEKGDDTPIYHHDSKEEPKYSFTAIIPCKHEKATIADTLRTMSRFNYPEHLKQILVVIHESSDDGTIGVVKDTIAELNATNISLVTYEAAPINKPHGLNAALEQATGDYVAIFDAEDEPNLDLLNLVNTFVVHNKSDVVQTGVQLMNYQSNWYSIFNVLEYYFWFKSSLHFFAKQGVVPLGGVSVFFRRNLLEFVGGWDETCLTEDADVGIRLSQIGAKISVVYQPEFSTQEETPPSVMSFIKQRTRWAQGFLQILFRGEFLRFPTYRQRFLALYILAWPLLLPFLFLFFPVGIFIMLTTSVPLAISVLSNILLLIIILFIAVQVVGFYEFTQDYKIKFPWSKLPILVLMFYPYTVLLAFSALRALYRNYTRVTTWEKTEHLNQHRAHRLAPQTVSASNYAA
jgi:glycosyltransferase XagB